jgi:hypothetical protein
VEALSDAPRSSTHSGSYRASRSTITRTASALSSISTKSRPFLAAASPVVPLPAKKSSTTSPRRECTLTMRSRMPSGFCVG